MTEYLGPGLRVVGGIILLFVSGEGLVIHAARLAERLRVPKVFVGAVVLGFGTSLPELFVSLTDAFTDDPGIAIGNVVGSNMANIGLILGLGAVLARFHLQARVVRVDLPFALMASIFLWAHCTATAGVTRIAGVVLLCAFVVYLVGSVRFAHGSREAYTEKHKEGPHPVRDVLWILGGLGGIVVGAWLLVHGAEKIARLAGVSELFVGLTVVALGTSLPELATLLAAVRRGEGDLAVGNVAGSNIFNLLFVLGVTATVRPMDVEPLMLTRDLPALAFFGVLAFPILSKERRIGRFHGFLLLLAYGGYWTWRSLD